MTQPSADQPTIDAITAQLAGVLPAIQSAVAGTQSDFTGLQAAAQAIVDAVPAPVVPEPDPSTD